MSSTSGFVLKNETVTPIVETVTGVMPTGYPMTTEFYPYQTTPVVGGGVVVKGTPFVGGCGVGMPTGIVGCGVGMPTGIVGGCGTGVVVPTGTTTTVETTTVVPTTTVGSIVSCGIPYNTYKYVVDVVNGAEDAYLTGHQIDGRVLYPTTGYLYLVWKSLAQLNGYKSIEEMPVVFENIEIHRATILALKQQLTGKQIEFCVRMVPKTGVFELVEGENVIVTGRVAVHESIVKLEQLKTLVQQHWTHLNERRRLVDLYEQEDIYRELRSRGYEYHGEFQPIVRADLEGTCGELMWTGKWIPFLDAMLQLNTLAQQRRFNTVGGGLFFPTRIRMIKIDPFAHFNMQKLYTKMFAKSLSMPTMRGYVGTGIERPYVFPFVFDPITSRYQCGGVEIVGINSVRTGIQNWLPVSPVVGGETIVRNPTVGLGLTNNFVPYVEKHFDEEYVIVDKCGGVESEPVSTVFRQNRELLEFYLGECKRYVSHILTKIEQPTVAVQTIMPTVIPRSIEQQLEGLKIEPTTTVTEMITGMNTPFAYGRLLESGKLLQLLMQVANIDSTDGQYLYKVQKYFGERHAYYRALEDDYILNLINNRSYYLKSMLDTVLENTHHIYQQIGGGYVRGPQCGVTDFVPRLRVLEISPSMGHFFGSKVNNLMRLYPNKHIGQVEYHYVPSMIGVHPTTVVPEEYIVELNKQLPYEIKKVEWNFGLKNGQLITEVPSHLREYDLVILNGGLSSLLPYVESEYELKKWLQTVVMEKVLKPQGFLFVHEYTNSFDFLTQLNRLEQIYSGVYTPGMRMTTGRYPYQKYQREMQWRQLIEECGFYPLSIKSDVELSSMMLYRRPYNWTSPVPTAMCEEKIWIDECFERPQEFYQRVRAALAERQFERVWLLSEREPTVEIVSVINSLRREIGGERIRCLFVADRQPVSFYGERFMVPSVTELIRTPLVQSQWKEIFPIVRRADLVMNVFRAGQWGSFRPIVNVRGLYPVTGGQWNQYPFVTGSTYPVPATQWTRFPVVPTVAGGYPTVLTHLPVGWPFECPTYKTVVPTPITNGVFERYPVVNKTVMRSVMSRGEQMFATGVYGAQGVVFNPLQTYIVTSGLGSFGLELVEWVIERGARRVIVTSKYGVRSGYQARKLRILRDEYNAHIQVLQVDVREEVECLGLIKEAVRMSVEQRIGGIFHLGSWVEESLFEQQYPVTQVHEVLRKITEIRCQGAINLDKLTRCEGVMDERGYFVVFSPVFVPQSSLMTMPTVLETICESRRRIGRHALAMHWGCNVETGFALERMLGYDVCEPTYVVPERVFTCLRILENTLIKSVEPTMWSHYVPLEKYWYPQTFMNTTVVPQYPSLVEHVLAVMGVKEMSRFVGAENMITLGELGLDNVLALELRQLLEQCYTTPLSIRDIHQLTLEKLRFIESRYPQGLLELYQPRPLTYLPRLRSVIKTVF